MINSIRKKDSHLGIGRLLPATLLLFPAFLLAQNGPGLTLDSCYALAEQNYPLVRQYALIERSTAYTLDNAANGTRPQYQLGGQATYQSDVTRLPISLPNTDIPTLSKDQYKLYGEVSQSLTDLYTVKHQKALIQANAAVETQKIEVEAYKLKERINQLFFGILLIDAQLRQTELLKKDIQAGLDKTNAAVANGAALKSSADLLQAELLRADQRRIELNANRKGFLDMLSLFINRPLPDDTALQQPAAVAPASIVNRPELRLFTRQQEAVAAQSRLLENRNLPRVSVFLQGGFGRPALNFLNNDFDLFYVGGLRFLWNLSGYKTTRTEQKLLLLNQNIIDLQRETFLLHTSVTLRQQIAEITRLQELIATDDAIIRLRESIRNTAKSQLENGVATSNDYIAYLNAEDQARQQLLLHQTQLLLAQYNHRTISGN